jgi:hypothetical protein
MKMLELGRTFTLLVSCWDFGLFARLTSGEGTVLDGSPRRMWMLVSQGQRCKSKIPGSSGRHQ